MPGEHLQMVPPPQKFDGWAALHKLLGMETAMSESPGMESLAQWLARHPEASEAEALLMLNKIESAQAGALEKRVEKAEETMIPFFEDASKLQGLLPHFMEALSVLEQSSGEQPILESAKFLALLNSAHELTAHLFAHTQLRHTENVPFRNKHKQVKARAESEYALNASFRSQFYHDVKNPLSAAISNIEYLQSTRETGALTSEDNREAFTDLVKCLGRTYAILADDLRYTLLFPSRQQRTPRDIKNNASKELLRAVEDNHDLALPLVLIESQVADLESRYRPGKNGPRALPEVRFGSTIDHVTTEQTSADTVVLYNLVSNIISNATTIDFEYGEKKIPVAGVDARVVDVSVFKEGDEVVIRVADKGVGLTPEQLNPASPKFIFRTGVTERPKGTKSTGLGLKEEIYYTKSNITINVVSRRREESEATYTPHSNNGRVQQLEALKSDAAKGGFSTIFEIRVKRLFAN
jgi:signal transduction histidine kinase